MEKQNYLINITEFYPKFLGVERSEITARTVFSIDLSEEQYKKVRKFILDISTNLIECPFWNDVLFLQKAEDFENSI